MNVQSTKEYSKFKKLTGNRDVRIGHVRFLISSISRKNLLAEHPIIINRNWEVIDGQHRIEAAKTLNIPIFYVFSESASIEDAQLLNYAARVWASRDFLKSLAENGNEDARFVYDFVLKNKVPVTVALQVSTTLSARAQKLLSLMRAGEFVADAKDTALLYEVMLSQYRSYATERASFDSNFARAVRKMLIDKPVEHVAMLNQLALYPHGIDRQVDERGYLRLFEEIYNYNRKTGRVRFF